MDRFTALVLVLVHGYQLSQFSAGARSRDPQSGTVGAVSAARTRGHSGPRRRLDIAEDIICRRYVTVTVSKALQLALMI